MYRDEINISAMAARKNKTKIITYNNKKNRY